MLVDRQNGSHDPSGWWLLYEREETVTSRDYSVWQSRSGKTPSPCPEPVPKDANIDPLRSQSTFCRRPSLNALSDIPVSGTNDGLQLTGIYVNGRAPVPVPRGRTFHVHTERETQSWQVESSAFRIVRLTRNR